MVNFKRFGVLVQRVGMLWFIRAAGVTFHSTCSIWELSGYGFTVTGIGWRWRRVAMGRERVAG